MQYVFLFSYVSASLAQEAAAKAGAATPLGAQAEGLYALFDRLGGGAKDFSAILELFRGHAPGAA
jgi:3-hydroxyisobutyrate dehydrogenase